MESPAPGSRMAAGGGGPKEREVSCFAALGFGCARSLFQKVKSCFLGFRLSHFDSSRETKIGPFPACPCVKTVSFLDKPEVIKMPLAITVQPDQQRHYGPRPAGRPVTAFTCEMHRNNVLAAAEARRRAVELADGGSCMAPLPTWCREGGTVRRLTSMKCGPTLSCGRVILH